MAQRSEIKSPRPRSLARLFAAVALLPASVLAQVAPEGATPAPATTEVAAAPAPATTEVAAATAVLSGVAVRDVGGDIVLELTTTTRANCTDYPITSGEPTLVLECAGLDMGEVQAVQQVGNGVIQRVEVAEQADSNGTSTQIRVVLAEMLAYEKVVTANAVTLTLRRAGSAPSTSADAIADALAAPATTPAPTASSDAFRLQGTRTGQLSSVDGDHGFANAGTQIRGVDFQQLLAEGVSRLVITGSSRLDYQWSSPADDQVVIAVKNAVLGSGLERRLDTSRYASAVKEVAAFRSRKSDGEVKVVVSLREKVSPNFQVVGDVLVVDFPIPPSVAGAAYTAPEVVENYAAPAVVEEVKQEDRIESATGRERQITGTGQALDPAKKARASQHFVFGTDAFLGEVPDGHQWKGQVMSLDFVDMKIHNVFRMISNVGKVNIITSDDVEGTVSMRMVGVPWDQALAAVLQSKSLGATQFGSIIRVAPIETIRKEREDAAAAQMAKQDAQELGIIVLPLNYASAGAVMKQLENMQSKRGTVNFDDRTNTLIVRDLPDNLKQIRELVRGLDEATPQVHISARIVEASQSFTRSLGIQWGGNLDFSPATGAPTGIFFPNSVGVSGGQTSSQVAATGGQAIGGRPTGFTTVPNYVVDLPAAGNAATLGLSLGSLTGAVNLDARLSASESAGTGKVIAQPSITTVTNQMATITDGARIPYETASLRGTNVQFVEAVLKLEVLPQITQDQSIFLTVNLTRNRPDFGNAVRNLPTIQIKEAKTTVMVADGNTTVIGGVFTYEEAINKNFVPGLGRIPVLGWLFKNSQKRVDRKELLVFITPTILRGVK